MTNLQYFISKLEDRQEKRNLLIQDPNISEEIKQVIISCISDINGLEEFVLKLQKKLDDIEESSSYDLKINDLFKNLEKNLYSIVNDYIHSTLKNEK